MLNGSCPGDNQSLALGRLYRKAWVDDLAIMQSSWLLERIPFVTASMRP